MFGLQCRPLISFLYYQCLHAKKIYELAGWSKLPVLRVLQYDRNSSKQEDKPQQLSHIHSKSQAHQSPKWR